jgi:hypothetical protein
LAATEVILILRRQSVRNILSNLSSLLLVVLIAGCDTRSTPEPETTLTALVAATKDLVDCMQKIQDANSAQAAIANYDSKLTAVVKNTKELKKLMSINEIQIRYLAERHKFTPFEKEIAEGALRITSEEERIGALPGLPVEFWKAVSVSGINNALIMAEFSLSPQDPNRPLILQFLKDMHNLYQTRPYEEILHIELSFPEDELIQKARDGLKKLLPDATMYQCQIEQRQKFLIAMAPVKDFNAVASAIDFGTIITKNENKRFLKIMGISSSKHADADEEDNSGDFGALPKKAKRPPQQPPAQRPPQAAPPQQEQPQPEKPEKKEDETKKAAAPIDHPDLDRKAADFYDQLAERVNSDDATHREKAIEELLNTSPDGISADTKKKIARAFKQLAEKNGPAAKQGIKGLVLWAGKYSGPILAKLLDRPQPPEEEQLIEALGQVKYAPAAQAIATRLASFDLYQCAFNALQELGDEAEDALIVVAPSTNPQSSLAAVELLGTCGTKKCLAVLRKVSASDHPKIREACQESLRKVESRSK